MPLTQEHVDTFNQQGVVVLHDYLPEEKRAAIANGLRDCLPSWDQVKDDPNGPKSRMQGFPYPALALNRFIVEPDLVWFAQQVLGTDDVQYRAGYSIVRYPGERVGSHQGWHIDNHNNSLLPPSEDRRYGQVVAWYFPEPVAADQGALMLIPEPHGNDQSHKIVLAVPGNTLAIFHNFIWHSGSDFTSDQGQRYSHGAMFGRADHPWEGFRHYTDAAGNPHFREFIGSLTARERQILRFPPPGHPYYTEQTLERLEAHYPGWNRGGEYTAALQTAGA